MTLAKLVIQAKMENRKMVFWGVSKYALRLAMKISFFENYCDYCVDSDEKKNGVNLQGFPPIYAPTKLLEEDKNTYVVVLTFVEKSVKAISKQLFEWGFSNVYADLTSIHSGDNAFEKITLERLESKKAMPTLSHRVDVLEKLGISKIKSLFHDEYSKTLLDMIVEKYKSIPKYGADFSDIHTPNHFFNDILADVMTDNEVYVDCGVFDTWTIMTFILWVKNKYKAIYGFEPELYSFNNLQNWLEDIPHCTIINKGLSDVIGTSNFEALSSVSSKMKDSGASQIKTTTLDTFFADKEPPTFIKMNIEGAEYKALLGAERIIKTYKPKLAICVYHEDDDLYTIPHIIKEFVPEYKLYLRHHSKYSNWEQVVYAKL
ncbi:MAG: FkbM family methyltransferase [Turicibacter sp.]|nr:FkbM family methyltransferase [Turicibacter sp.]